MSSRNVHKPKHPHQYGKNVPRSFGQNVLRQNVPIADQFFSAYMECVNKTCKKRYVRLS